MREFDVVLYGATGFTGRQAVRYFSRFAPVDLRWAVAGRDKPKLDALQAGVPAIVAGPDNRASVDALVGRTRIVLSTAGPFELYSDSVVDACVRFGTHYVDITGETLWVRSLIDRYHDRAAANGTRIIPFCGFDSIPSDLGATWVAEQLGEAVEVKAYYRLKAGPPNGGTVATAFRQMSLEARGQLQDPFLLGSPSPRAARALEHDPIRAAFDRDVNAWVTPFIMGGINTRVVRRTCALLGLDFAYQEYFKAGGATQAFAIASLTEWLKRSLQISVVRRAFQRLSPQPGTGPTEQAMDEGWFRCEFFARASDGRNLHALVSGAGDPANRITVKCVCESALTLACDADRLPARAGILTPSAGLGPALRERLIARGIDFAVVAH
jgi:short subunit dehydrogenase-like uncharacterized protein